MDAVLYDALDAAVSHPQLRCNMTLNLNLQESRPQPRNPLTSPDLQLLKLSSPELERLIIQSCSGLTPTTAASTPTRPFPPKHVTDEQEGFADGFFRALAELHSQQQMPCVPGAEGHPVVAPPTCAGFGERVQDAQPVWDGYADAPIGPHVPPNFQCTDPLKEEPQRVPETPPLSPIDMEDQERIKAERKRMRNRVAASKCRKRKLERLARLEERVGRLSGENGELRTVAQALRDQVLHLRHELLEHIKSGCKQLSQQLHAVKDF